MSDNTGISGKKNKIIESRDLVKKFGDFEAVKGVSFSVFQGECFGLLGPNGAGKTSIVKMIYGFSPITSGEMQVFGEDISARARAIKTRIGVVPQEDNLDPELSVWDNLMVYAGYFRIKREQARERAGQVLDLMGLDTTAKVQIHVGGVYGDKPLSMDRFADKYDLLDPVIKNRLVIENDERLYSISDCLDLHERTGIPIIADLFHHALHNNAERFADLLTPLKATWKARDGIPMVDYSSQEPGKRAGAHAEHIVPDDFRQFLNETRLADFDIMLEIKDKEKSALCALDIAREDPRLVT
ncbi:MAG: hypothetical protein CVV34_00285 [Methanomicrobiales archaeon HGW-Methanomicrobiales-5]|nr:MAG: hypothetical protein CVV34_00285 [Methanomicrobiales archaeon HGW-Methanomicrobiales-5]